MCAFVQVKMVLFSNINLNQRVELLYNHAEVLRATVKYKGAVNTLDGDWVGLALDKPGLLFNVSILPFIKQLRS